MRKIFCFVLGVTALSWCVESAAFSLSVCLSGCEEQFDHKLITCSDESMAVSSLDSVVQTGAEDEDENEQFEKLLGSDCENGANVFLSYCKKECRSMTHVGSFNP